MRKKVLALIALATLPLTLLGCAGFHSMAETLNERNVTSCIWLSGGYPPFANGRGLIATGGATLADCAKF